MSLNIPLTPELEQSLRQKFGTSLEREAREIIALAWFAQGRISSPQVASLLELSLEDAQQFLQDRAASTPSSTRQLSVTCEKCEAQDAARERIASKMPSREEWQKIIKKSREAGAAEKQQQLEDTEMNS